MRKMIPTIASILLSVFFIFVMLFVMLDVVKVQDSYAGVRAFIFAGIDFLLILLLIGFGKGVSRIVGRIVYPLIAIITAVYTLLNLLFNLWACSFFKNTSIFTMINLISLFIYVCVTVILAVVGSGHKTHMDDDQGKTNNINNINYNIRR